LTDSSQPLKIRVGYDLMNQWIINGDESVNRVVYYFVKSH
jgi:hypothetical protein